MGALLLALAKSIYYYNPGNSNVIKFLIYSILFRETPPFQSGTHQKHQIFSKSL